MFITAKLEDTVLVAEYREDLEADKIPDLDRRPSVWHVSITDLHAEQVKTAKWNDAQMSDFIALMLGGGEEEEDLPEHVT